jgi:hypothetical protein
VRWVRELVGASSGWLQSEEATLGAFPPIPIPRRTRRRHSGAAIRSCSAVGVAWRQNSVGAVQRIGRTELVSLDAREGVAGNGARKDRRSERRPWGRNADLLSVERALSACDRSLRGTRTYARDASRAGECRLHDLPYFSSRRPGDTAIAGLFRSSRVLVLWSAPGRAVFRLE